MPRPSAAATLLTAVLGAGIVLMGGCTRVNPDFCGEDAQICGEGFFCNLDRNACEPGICSPGVAESCTADGESLDVCADDGQSFVVEDCEFGCNTDRTECNECAAGETVCDLTGAIDELTVCADDGTLIDARACYLGCRSDGDSCVDVDPSNGLATDLDFIDAEPGEVIDLVLEEGFEVRADGSIRDAENNVITAVNSREVPQGGELPIRVFRVRRLTINGTISVVGANPVAFVSDRDIIINGRIDVSAGRISDRGVNACVGQDPSTSGDDDSGGGGGGFARNGGNGGDADAAAGGAGGSQHGGSDLEPLVGGCDGGKGSGNLTLGGAGGGALQLVTRQRIQFGAMGAIQASGGGGGFEMVVGTSAASGGGSGGGVLLEAPIIDFETGAFIAANGGGGGCALTSGERGRLDMTAAAGALCDAPAGDGGDGGSEENQNADSGQDANGTGASGGGGGGSHGRIRTNTAIGQTISDAFFSPSPSTDAIDTR